MYKFTSVIILTPIHTGDFTNLVLVRTRSMKKFKKTV